MVALARIIRRIDTRLRARARLVRLSPSNCWCGVQVLFIGVALLVAALFGIWFISDQYGKMTKPWYWLTIVAARTAGTTLGDLLASRRGLGLGLWVSTICTSLLLAGIVILFRHGRAERLREA